MPDLLYTSICIFLVQYLIYLTALIRKTTFFLFFFFLHKKLLNTGFVILAYCSICILQYR